MSDKSKKFSKHRSMSRTDKFWERAGNKAVLYVRVSSIEQSKGQSLESQEEILLNDCQRKGIEVIEVYRESRSAKSFEKRNVFGSAFERLRQDASIRHLLVTRWDRFSRNLTETAMMVDKLRSIGIVPNAVEQPIDLNIPESKVILAVYWSVAEAENLRRGKNIKNGLDKALRSGRYPFKAPFGYFNEKKGKGSIIQIDEAKAPIVQQIFEEFCTGAFSMEELRRKYAKQHGLEKSQFNRLMKHPIYAGYMPLTTNNPDSPIEIYEDTISLHQPIISKELYHTAQDIIYGRNRKSRKTTKKNGEFYLRGFLICDECDGNLTTSYGKGKYPYYHCQNGCTRFRAEIAHNKLSDVFSAFAVNHDMIDLFDSVMKDFMNSKSNINQTKLLTLKKDLSKSKADKELIEDKFIHDQISKEVYEKHSANCVRQIITLEAELAALENLNKEIQDHFNASIPILRNFNYYFQNAEPGVKTEMIGSIFSDKLHFDQKKYRTTSINQVIPYIFSNINDLVDIEKFKKKNFDDLSPNVEVRGIEPLSEKHVPQRLRT